MHFFFVLLSCSFFVAYIFIKFSFLELGYLSSLLSIILISTFQTFVGIFTLKLHSHANDCYWITNPHEPLPQPTVCWSLSYCRKK